MLIVDTRELVRASDFMGIIEKQIPFATKLALNRTGREVKRDEVETMKRVFDRPTRFTLNSLQLTTARKDNLQAEVWLKNPSRLSYRKHYLESQIHGGRRELKRFEKMLGGKYMMPGGGLKLDRNGNIRGSSMVKILSGLKRFDEVGHMMNVTQRSKRRNRKRAEYFLLNDKRDGLVPGVWQRVPGRRGISTVRPILIAGRSPRYRKRLPYFEVFQRSVAHHYPRELRKAIDHAMRTAR